MYVLKRFTPTGSQAVPLSLAPLPCKGLGLRPQSEYIFQRMRFDLHTQAISAFNEQATMVSESIGLREPDRKGTQSFRADVHVGSKLSDADVAGPVIFGEIDQHGNRVCRYIEDASGVIGLNEQGYAGLLKLARAVQKTEPFRDAISVQFLEDVLFRWSVSKLKRETTLTACEYMSAEALRAVSRQEIGFLFMV